MERPWFLNKVLFLLAATIIGSGTLLYPQNMSVEYKVKPAFKEYFGLPRASVFLHLNKSAYVKGEEIWFKGYLYNRLKNTPLKEPLNLYIGVYDSDGNQIKKELFISENGISQGQIMIDSSFSGGLYYIKATTSWMRNFKEDDSYVQQFKVIEEAEAVVEKGKGDLDVQFLPEGGHLIVGVQGTVGVKVLNELGYGVNGLEGLIKNKFGDSIVSFTTNRFGLGKFDILPKKNERYSAYLKDGKGNEFRLLLPNSEKKGIAMSIKRISPDRIMILLGTNPVTRSELGSKSYSLLLHRDGLLKTMLVNFPPNEYYVSYILDTKELHRGMNIVTLIDNRGNPVAERLVFNSHGVELGALSTSLKILEKDSVQLTLFKNKKSDSLQFLSASILPLGTQAYKHKKNILSTLLLSPYVRGFIEHPSYYFTESLKDKENSLDLLLLTQGWSRFNWENMYDDPPVKNYDFRTGVNLYGKLNIELGKKENLLMYSDSKKDQKIIQLNQGSNEFLLKNYYLEKDDELQFTIVGTNGKPSRPNLYLRLNDGVTTDNVYYTRREDFEMIFPENSEPYKMDDFIMPDKTIVLDEAVVVEDKKEKNFTSPIVSERRITKVTKQIRNMYPSIIDIIRSNGFRVVITPNVGYDRIRVTSMRNRTIPALYIDDVFQPDFNMLEDIFTEEVGSYFIDRSGNAESGAGGGVIRLYRRKWSDDDGLNDTKDPKFFKHVVEKGFRPIKEFYVPNYRSFTDNAFINFGTIHWEPNIILDKQGKATFGFDSAGWKEFKIFIEGMGADGTLFSTTKTIQLDKNQ